MDIRLVVAPQRIRPWEERTLVEWSSRDRPDRQDLNKSKIDGATRLMWETVEFQRLTVRFTHVLVYIPGWRFGFAAIAWGVRRVPERIVSSRSVVNSPWTVFSKQPKSAKKRVSLSCSWVILQYGGTSLGCINHQVRECDSLARETIRLGKVHSLTWSLGKTHSLT